MDELQVQVKKSFRTEMLAAGLYGGLAKQHEKKNPLLHERLREASRQELMHGRMFRKYYRSSFGANPGSEKLWVAAGRIIAMLMVLVPLKKKLGSLSVKESEAVSMIEAKLGTDCEPSYRKILSRILPDEVSHASIYSEVFPA